MPSTTTKTRLATADERALLQLLARGLYSVAVPKPQQRIAELEAEIDRLNAALAAKENDDANRL